MGKERKVSILFGAVGIIAIIFAIFAYNGRVTDTGVSVEIREARVKELKDSIEALSMEIASFKKRVDSLNSERDKIRVQIKKIIENEKVDRVLANGDWDANIRFLSDFLSKEDTLGKRHHPRNN